MKSNQDVGWPQDIVEVIPSSCSVIPFLRDRCLVGILGDWKGPVPRAKEIEEWCNFKWGIGPPVEVKDMNGSMYMFILPSKHEVRRVRNRYMFILPSKDEACRVRNGRWDYEGVTMELRYWGDWCGCFEEKHKPEALWVRVLGLPVFLWSEDLFRVIGDRIGGFIMTAEETLCRDHVKWARISVKGPGTLIPASLSIGMDSLVYECPIWVESDARVSHWSDPTRYCDGERWTEMMGKEKVSEGGDEAMQRARGADRSTVGGTRGGLIEVILGKTHQRPKSDTDGRTSQKRLGQRPVNPAYRASFSSKVERRLWLEEPQKKRSRKMQTGEGRTGYPGFRVQLSQMGEGARAGYLIGLVEKWASIM